jgi:hypothetical protein
MVWYGFRIRPINNAVFSPEKVTLHSGASVRTINGTYTCTYVRTRVHTCTTRVVPTNTVHVYHWYHDTIGTSESLPVCHTMVPYYSIVVQLAHDE